MNKYGIVLTGREYGKNAAVEIFSSLQLPEGFDFAGVASMGSSFGDEIFKLGASKGIKKFSIFSANKVVQASLHQIQKDLGLVFEYASPP